MKKFTVTTPKKNKSKKNCYKVKYIKSHGGEAGSDNCTEYMTENELQALYVLAANQGDIPDVVKLITKFFKDADCASDWVNSYDDHYYYESTADIYGIEVTWMNNNGQEFNVTVEIAND